jgi:glucokinase
MLLAGDVGGTKTLLGLFDVGDPRPAAVAAHEYVTTDYDSFTEILDAFSRDIGRSAAIDAVAVGVAGPVVANRGTLTNIAWNISGDEIGARLQTERVRLLNDLEAMANSVEVLAPDEVLVLQEGVARSDGNAAVIAAGTGMGQAYLHRQSGRLRPVPSEGGHADFAPRTDREIELMRMLRELYGRAEVEHVLSGPGLLNIHRFTHRGGECEMLKGVDPRDAPPMISRAGLSGRCQGCADALAMFVSAYGAEAGNMALRGMAVSGLYVGGGIAPKILPALKDGRFMDAFLAKEPMRELLSKVPVRIILNVEAGLLGAAVYAQELVGKSGGSRA